MDLNWLMGPQPGERLRALHAMRYLDTYLPEVAKLYGVPQRPEHHPEVDTGIHIELCLNVAAEMNLSHRARFAVLVHDLGKGLTPAEEWPRHFQHEKKGLPPVTAVCLRAKVPLDWMHLALVVCSRHLDCHRAFELTSRTAMELVDDLGPLLEDFTHACEADARGRHTLQDRAYPQAAFLRQLQRRLVGIPCLGLDGEGKELRRLQNDRRHDRLNMVRTTRAEFTS